MALLFRQHSKGHTRVAQQCLDGEVMAKGQVAGPIPISTRVALLQSIWFYLSFLQDFVWNECSAVENLLVLKTKSTFLAWYSDRPPVSTPALHLPLCLVSFCSRWIAHSLFLEHVLELGLSCYLYLKTFFLSVGKYIIHSTTINYLLCVMACFRHWESYFMVQFKNLCSAIQAKLFDASSILPWCFVILILFSNWLHYALIFFSIFLFLREMFISYLDTHIFSLIIVVD